EDGSSIVLLAQDRGGYANLCRLITKGRRRSEKGESAVSWDEVCAHAPGLIALWNGANASVVPVLGLGPGKAAADIQTNSQIGKNQHLNSGVSRYYGKDR